MSEADLQRRIDELQRELEEAKQLNHALVTGEIDSVTSDGVVTPMLLRAAQERLRASEQLLRAVFDGANDAILITDAQGRYVDANPAACGILGVAKEDVIGKTVADFAAKDQAFSATWSEFLAAGRLAGDFAIVRPDRGRRDLEFNAVANVLPGRHLSVLRDVTARKAAEAALRRSEALFRAMIEHSSDGITLLAADATTLYQSPAVERLLGYTPEEARSMSWHDFVEEDQHALVASTLGKVLETPGNTVSIELRVRRRDGALRSLELTATNLLHDPAVGAIVSNFRDVTDRRTLEREQQNFFSMSVDLLSISTFDGYFRRVNPAWERALGWTTDELTSMPWSELLHPDDREATARVLAGITAGGTVAGFENRYRRKDGAYRRLEWSSIPSVEEKVVYSVARDVTEQRARAELDRLLFARNPIAMWLLDGESLRFLDVNEAATKMYGYSRDELLAMRLTDIVVEEETEIRRRVDDVLAAGGFVHVARQHRVKGGGLRDVEKTDHRVDVGGRVQILGVVVDVTFRNSTQLELAASEARYRRIVENTSEGIWIYDEEGKTQFMNPRMATMLGYGVEEVVGKPISAFMDEQAAGYARARIARRIRGESEQSEQSELSLRRKDGTELWVAVHADPLLDGQGRFENALALVSDITERRRDAEALRQSEQQLRQAQKMEAVGSLAGGIAHDFNNLLSVILSYADLMLDELQPADPLHADVEEVRKASLRAADLTRQLLAFSRKQMLQPAVVDMNQVVGELEKMLRRLVGEDVSLVITTCDDAGMVEADRGQLEQVIMNLVVNARDAMPSGGSLTIDVDHAALDASQAMAHGAVKPGAYTVLSVSDTGMGIDRATQARIFEPFFTTKEKGKGTGLGLSTVYGIVQQSGGHIVVESEMGRGTSFRVYLPHTNRAPAATEEAAVPTTLRGGETILLVEDEPQVRTIVRAILRKSGYHVLEAENGGEAFLASEQFEGRIQLLLTDVVMPRMNGRQLAERLLKQRTDMRVLYVSGYTEDKLGQHGVLDPEIDFLPKPITRDALLKKVRQVLDRGAPP